MKKLFGLFLLLLLCGCASFGRGLMQGFMEEQNKKKNDVSCTLISSGFPGLQRVKESVIKVLLVHGIGNHTPGHSMAFMLDISKKMGMDELVSPYKQIQMRNKDGDAVGILRVYRFSNAKTGKSVIFYEQTWSQITEPFKKKLSYDNTKEYAFHRAKINEDLKKYLNETLPDSSIYLGPIGDRMLASSVQSFCWMSHFTFDQLPNNADRTCTTHPEDALQSLQNENFAFITNSLGSRIAIDSLQLIAEKMQMKTTDKATVEALKALQNKEITIFMLANQLPLLQMGKKPPRHQGEEKAFCIPDGLKYDERLFKKLYVVAISDPNDLLSYGLQPESVDSYLDSALCPEVSNVSITTVPTFDLGIGELANPLSAHTQYQSNPYVLDLIVEGLENNYTSPQIEDKCRWIHLQEKGSKNE